MISYTELTEIIWKTYFTVKLVRVFLCLWCHKSLESPWRTSQSLCQMCQNDSSLYGNYFKYSQHKRVLAWQIWDWQGKQLTSWFRLYSPNHNYITPMNSNVEQWHHYCVLATKLSFPQLWWKIHWNNVFVVIVNRASGVLKMLNTKLYITTLMIFFLWSLFCLCFSFVLSQECLFSSG